MRISFTNYKSSQYCVFGQREQQTGCSRISLLQISFERNEAEIAFEKYAPRPIKKMSTSLVLISDLETSVQVHFWIIFLRIFTEQFGFVKVGKKNSHISSREWRLVHASISGSLCCFVGMVTVRHSHCIRGF
jgi:hypothetical protein